MQHFEDDKGRGYDLDISMGTSNRIAAKFGFDLMDPEKNAAEISAATRAIKVALDVIWFLVRDQAKIHRLNWNGDTELDENDFENAWLDSFSSRKAPELLKAFRDEVIFFIQQTTPERVDAIQSLMAKSAKLTEMENQAVAEFVDDPETDRILKDRMQAAKKKARESLSVNGSSA